MAGKVYEIGFKIAGDLSGNVLIWNAEASRID